LPARVLECWGRVSLWLSVFGKEKANCRKGWSLRPLARWQLGQRGFIHLSYIRQWATQWRRYEVWHFGSGVVVHRRI